MTLSDTLNTMADNFMAGLNAVTSAKIAQTVQRETAPAQTPVSTGLYNSAANAMKNNPNLPIYLALGVAAIGVVFVLARK